uniref:Uncharacterized protein n=1 Tax=Cacopsylla melanoneura TaxID=428564 RepID=A0A8D8YRP0_9HEMI
MGYSRHSVFFVVLVFGPICMFAECDQPSSDSTDDSATSIENENFCYNTNLNQNVKRETPKLSEKDIATPSFPLNQKITDYEKFLELVSPKKQLMCPAQYQAPPQLKMSKMDINFSVSNSSREKLSSLLKTRLPHFEIENILKKVSQTSLESILLAMMGKNQKGAANENVPGSFPPKKKPKNENDDESKSKKISVNFSATEAALEKISLFLKKSFPNLKSADIPNRKVNFRFSV